MIAFYLNRETFLKLLNFTYFTEKYSYHAIDGIYQVDLCSCQRKKESNFRRFLRKRKLFGYDDEKCYLNSRLNYTQQEQTTRGGIKTCVF